MMVLVVHVSIIKEVILVPVEYILVVVVPVVHVSIIKEGILVVVVPVIHVSVMKNVILVVVVNVVVHILHVVHVYPSKEHKYLTYRINTICSSKFS